MPENTNTAAATPEGTDTAAVPAEMPVAAPEADTGTDTADSADDDDSADDSHPGRREARYRTKLRQAEAENDELRTTVANLRRAQVDAVISSHGVKPAAVWASGAELADLIGADGLPDRAAVKAAVAATRSEFGIAGKARPDATGLKSGAGLPQSSPPRWAAAFGPRDK